MLIPRIAVGMFSVGLMMLGAGAVSGQDYPNKPIRIVTSAAGGANDFLARLIAQGTSGTFGQQVIVDNRPGIIAIELIPKAQPDGYTLLVMSATLWTGPLLQRAPYDPVRDFSPVTLMVRSPNILVVHPLLPVKSVKELIALAKARPGELNYASVAIGGSTHLTAELFNSMAGIKIVNISYKGAAQAINDLHSGQVQMTFDGGSSLMPHIKSGKLRALAVTSAQPSALFPGLPAVAASLPGYESISIYSVFAPAKTPETIINRLNQDIVRYLNMPETKERLLNFGVEVVGSSPEELAAKMKSEMARWSRVIKDAGIRVE